MLIIDNLYLLQRQALLQQAQQLAARLPETGLTPDELALSSLEELMGKLAFLKRFYDEKQVL